MICLCKAKGAKLTLRGRDYGRVYNALRSSCLSSFLNKEAYAILNIGGRCGSVGGCCVRCYGTGVTND